MSKVTKIIAYSNKPLDFLADEAHVTYGNPQFYVKPVQGAVYFWSDNEKIIADYEKMGVPMYPLVKADAAINANDPLPVGWEDLSWPKMRSLAAKYTSQAVKDKTFAMETLTQAEKLFGVLEVVEESVTEEVVEEGVALDVANEFVDSTVTEDSSDEVSN